MSPVDEQFALVTAAAGRLPLEARAEFMSAAAAALTLLEPGADAPRLIEKLLRVKLLRAADGSSEQPGWR
jgi:hypothetical protein